MDETLKHLSLREAAAEIARREKWLCEECGRRRLAEAENRQLRIDRDNYPRWWQEDQKQFWRRGLAVPQIDHHPRQD